MPVTTPVLLQGPCQLKECKLLMLWGMVHVRVRQIGPLWLTPTGAGQFVLSRGNVVTSVLAKVVTR
jgi:hypothetical protein